MKPRSVRIGEKIRLRKNYFDLRKNQVLEVTGKIEIIFAKHKTQEESTMFFMEDRGDLWEKI